VSRDKYEGLKVAGVVYKLNEMKLPTNNTQRIRNTLIIMICKININFKDIINDNR